MPLPYSEQWDRKLVRRRIEFEVNVARSLRSLSVEMARFSGYINADDAKREPDDIMTPLVRAAEFAFAIDDVEIGLLHCESAVSKSLGASEPATTPMEEALATMIGAVAGDITVEYFGSYIVRHHGDRTVVARQWEGGSSPHLLELRRRYICAAIANGDPGSLQRLSDSSQSESSVAAVDNLLAATAEGRIVVAMQRSGQPDLIRCVHILAALEEAYDERLEALASDHPHWENLRPRGDLIDWPLLSMWTGLLRRFQMPTAARPRNRAALFIRGLARALSQRQRR